eukprot:9031734-Pyramimonas_sp.AAC.1
MNSPSPKDEGPFWRTVVSTDLAFSMSAPTGGAWNSLAKLGNFLNNHDMCGNPHLYKGGHPHELTVWTDIDCAGCKKTRKPTTGGT